MGLIPIAHRQVFQKCPCIVKQYVEPAESMLCLRKQGDSGGGILGPAPNQVTGTT